MHDEHSTPDLASHEEERKRLVGGLLFGLGFSCALVGFFLLLEFLFA